MGSGSSLPFQEDMHVVIVGGGYAGVTLAVNLMKTCKVTLIDPKDSFVHNVGALRSCVEPTYSKKIFIPYEPSFGESFVRGKVVRINRVNKESNSVTLEDGRDITYTHLVIATGSAGPFPGKVTRDYPDVSKEKGVELYEEINKEILAAETIVCVGGGAVGVELAGEVKTDFPDKNIILIHSSEVLCSPDMKAKTQAMLHAALSKKGITLMLGERVSNLDELQMNKTVSGQVLKTESGKEVKADLVFPCTGMKLATSLFREDIGDAMDELGQIKVDEYFLVEGTKNIYAIGDITNIKEGKMAFLAGCQADELAKNLIAGVEGKNLTPHKPSGEFLMIIPVGRDGGVSQLKGCTVGDFITRNLKSKHLFTSRYWNNMKQKEPST